MSFDKKAHICLIIFHLIFYPALCWVVSFDLEEENKKITIGVALFIGFIGMAITGIYPLIEIYVDEYKKRKKEKKKILKDREDKSNKIKNILNRLK